MSASKIELDNPDINNQGGDQQELYWYMNSGHYNPEAWRTGFFGP
jgi:rhamnogalacturonan endolyase